LKYDDVMNDQRKVVFEQRREFMGEADVQSIIAEMRHGVIDDCIARHIPEGAYPEQWNVDGLAQDVIRYFNLDLPIADWAKEEGIAEDGLRERIRQAGKRFHANDNISEFIRSDVEREALKKEVETRVQSLLESLVIDTKDYAGALTALAKIPQPADTARTYRRYLLAKVDAYIGAGKKDSAKAILEPLVAKAPNNKALQTRMEKLK